MQHRSIILVLLSLALVTSALPASGDTLAEVALGSPHSADFDANEGGWTASEPPAPYRPASVSSWAWGAPTSGPGVAFSGSKVWATNPAGPYLARDCGAILSPPIDLTDAASASVSFMQWRHMEESTTTTGFANDAGLLYVTADDGLTLTKVTPAGGYTSKRISSTARTCLDGEPDTLAQGLSGPAGTTVPGPTYSAVSADLSAFSGQVVRFAIAFAADCCTHRAGWYIDDFSVTIDGVTTTETFESGDGGFSVVSTYALLAPEGFEWGEPGPGGPASTSPMWATNLDGNYASGECTWIESPVFRLGEVADPGVGVLRATLTWNQWFRSNSLYSAGIVQVGVKQPDGSFAYEQVTPVGGYPGKVDGTYVDQLTGCLGVPTGSGSFEGLVDAVGGPMRAYAADLSAFTGSDVTVRFGFATAWSNLNPALHPGWYIDDVNVDLELVVEGPAADDLVPDPSSPGLLPPGWSAGGQGSTWEYGLATYGPVGEIVLATNLTGRHADPECSWAETPEISGSLLALNPTLRFEHFYDIYAASTAGAAWSGAAVFLSTDAGATWKYLNLPDYDLEARYTDTRNCLNSLDPTVPKSGTVYPRVFSGNHSEWETVNVDLSAYSDAPTVKVRFVFSSGIAIYRDGYNLRSAELAGVKIL
ncbi:MAG TPA: hypothetical protein VFH78_01975 [Candidatus Thermoplasmatota archaeon]|nr:hypothetical protein [Candidatus Thermoplasmatota archaeon]